MRSVFSNKPIRSIRRPSLAGNGLPERMRSTAFAFLGLTAAAGLALVAIFAQLGFPLLSPVPLPDVPAEPSSVSKGVPVERDSAAVGLAPARDAVVASGVSRGQEGSGAERGDLGARVDGSATSVSGAPGGDSPDSPEPVTTSPPAPAPDPATAPVSTPTATATTESSSPPAEAPAESPGTEAKPARSKPVKPPKAKPARSEPKPVKPEAAPAPQPKYVPAPASTPVDQGKDEGRDKGNGNGNGEDPENR